MFVCTGNICRSPLAHAFFNHEVDSRGLISQLDADSSGTDAYHVGDRADPRMRAVALRYGIHEIEAHISKPFNKRDFERFDLILTMDRSHQNRLLRLARNEQQKRKCLLFRSFDPETEKRDADVPDPYYGGAEGFEQVYRMIERTCHALIDALCEER